jgi:S1-C subfamily serine protease
VDMKVWFYLYFILITLSVIPCAYARSECRESLTDIYEKNSPSVVFISTVDVDLYKYNNQMTSVIGSGFIIDKQGIILTNSHLVYGRRLINITLDDGSLVEAKLIGADPIFDLALLRISVPHGKLQEVIFGDSETLRVGESVVAIGNPFGLEQTLSRGIVSGINRVLSASPMSLPLPLIQTDAAINPGSSGGPLLNRCGEVIGITSSILSDAQNIAFAIPIHVVKSVLPELKKHGRVIRPWIGIQGKLISKDLEDIFNIAVTDGFLVETIEPGSPAEKANLNGGILPISIGGMDFLFGGDIITAINGHSITDLEKLEKILQSLKVGDTIHLRLYFEEKERTVMFNLIERPVLPQDSLSERILLPIFRDKKGRNMERNKQQIPEELKSIEEIQNLGGQNSTADYWDKMEAVDMKISPKLKLQLELNKLYRILDLSPKQIADIEAKAKRENITGTQLIYRWILEHI